MSADIYGTTPIAVDVDDNVSLEELVGMIDPIYIEEQEKVAFKPVSLTSEHIISNTGYDGSVEGTYYLEFQYTGKNTGLQAEKIIEVRVSDSGGDAHSAEITANNVTMIKDGYFDVMITPNVKATETNPKGDKTDITDFVEVIYNNVNTKKVGSYSVTYSVNGPNNTHDVHDIIVKVVDPSIKDAIIEADDIKVNIGEGPTSDKEIIEQLRTKAFDPKAGDITDRVNIVDKDNYDKNTVGKYTIVLSVIGSNGVTVTDTAVIEVYDEGSTPNNDATADVYGNNPIVINKDDNLSIADVIDLIKPVYVEEKAGKVYNPITLDESNITAVTYENVNNLSTNGKYYFEFQYTGKNTGLQAEKVFTVLVYDFDLLANNISVEVGYKDLANDSTFKDTVFKLSEVVSEYRDENNNTVSFADDVKIDKKNFDVYTVGTYGLMLEYVFELEYESTTYSLEKKYSSKDTHLRLYFGTEFMIDVTPKNGGGGEAETELPESQTKTGTQDYLLIILLALVVLVVGRKKIYSGKR